MRKTKPRERIARFKPTVCRRLRKKHTVGQKIAPSSPFLSEGIFENHR